MDVLLIVEITTLIVIINTIVAVITVFHEKRDISAIWAWLLVLIVFPIIGFFVYAIFGRKMTDKKIFNMKSQIRLGIDTIVTNQELRLNSSQFTETQKITKSAKELVNMFLKTDKAILTEQNHVEIFTDGKEKFASLFRDLQQAQHHINIEYFTIRNDKTGQKLVQILEERAAAGIRVRVIYDQFGSHGRNKKLFKKLVELGGEVEPFLASRFQILTFRVNFRDHRKLVVIDGKIGYIGGFNVSNQYIEPSKKFGYWRDTHLRIQGDGVLALQSRFFLDWNATHKTSRVEFNDKYFPRATTINGSTAMQIVSSGPDSDLQQIKRGYMQMIATARESILIQTPYFIPDSGMLEVIQNASLSGIDVHVMIPSVPDHPFVYQATKYYANEILQCGASVSTYNGGFLHAKVLVVDGKMASVGSANFDIRSFRLNFEGNAFMYDKKVAQELQNIFNEDLKRCTPLTLQDFLNQSLWQSFKQRFSRLLSPIL
ncbi:cardiolipin synthase [Periweissella fabalis]|uniref:Cardiolipin synthase n=1 Tax=Periweissella fabalis TaxID=1070421 RepID=A0A7X6N3A6_9LACO|nr:cardiolipin synthase [Periweissella fabalis]MCM0598677.1 cardiolipin synthase [Periweissella fabalis]NKZ24330.1 cardiolipin synthase [Periweissella fabalis]